MDAVPVVATADEHLREDVLRWCAAAGAVPEVVSDVAGVRRAWRGAALVAVGSDLAPLLVDAGLPRRDHVLLVDGDLDGTDPWPTAVALGAVDVVGTSQERRAVEAMVLALDGRSEGCLVSVVGAVGGVGASTFAAVLARRAVGRGLDSMVLDLDVLGGGLDLVLGSEEAEGVRWQDLQGSDGSLPAGSLVEVLPRADGLGVLTFARDLAADEPAALSGVVGAATRGFDLVVADLPRHEVATMHEVVGRSVCTVVLVPEETRALAAARALLVRLGELTAQVTVLSVSRPGGLDSALVQRAVDRPVLARLRPDRRLRAAVEQGHGPRLSRSAASASAKVLDLLGLTDQRAAP